MSLKFYITNEEKWLVFSYLWVVGGLMGGVNVLLHKIWDYCACFFLLLSLWCFLFFLRCSHLLLLFSDSEWEWEDEWRYGMRISSKERQRLESSKTEQRDVYLCTLQRAFKISINLIKEFSCFFLWCCFQKVLEYISFWRWSEKNNNPMCSSWADDVTKRDVKWSRAIWRWWWWSETHNLLSSHIYLIFTEICSKSECLFLFHNQNHISLSKVCMKSTNESWRNEKFQLLRVLLCVLMPAVIWCALDFQIPKQVN